MLNLYNTLSRRIEPFEPISPPQVGLYTCGPTVYSTPHIGNYRSYIFADVLRRALKMNDYLVTQVMNITDVGHLTSDADEGEDKLEKGARAEGQTVWDVAQKHTKEFKDGLKKLNVLEPDVWAVATDHIKHQIELIQKLVARGHTYETPQAVYFDVSTFKSYGQLSKQKLTDKKTGARSEVVTDTGKKHPADFVLWFKRTGKFADHIMHWPSPWGDGFPGWHIECSAMSMKYLGEQFDIHTGGIDHIPVHHENEIAQSEAATGKHPFVRVWLHGEHLILPKKRMGKSEGNAITLNDVSQRGIHPLAFRYLVLQTHYRSKLTFSWDALKAADDGLQRLWLTIDTAEAAPQIGCAEFEQRFRDAINHDLDTPPTLAVMHQMLKSEYPWSAKLQSLTVFERVFGLGLTKLADREHFQPIDASTLDRVNQLIQQREAVRQAKDWKQADELRQQINAMLKTFHRTLEDTPEGPEIRPHAAR